jgi:hypothetical protein
VFDNFGAPAAWVPRLIAIVIMVEAIATDYELGFCKVLSMETHLRIDYALGGVLAISPWLFGFARHTPIAVVVIETVGLIFLATSLFTEPHARHGNAIAESGG